MKKVKEYLVPTFVLFVICLIAAVLLGVTNEVTAPTIAANDAKAAQEAMADVLPEGKDFSQTGENEFGSYAVAKDESGKIVGYAVTAVGKGGYNGEITLMVGVDAEGAVTKLNFLSIDETPSVGGKLTTKADWLAQFIGLKESAALTKNGGTVDAVSGATKTSTGITDAVNNALECYAKITEEVSANG